MKTNNNRTLLQSLLNGDGKGLRQLKANKLPTVFVAMPDGTLDIGDSKAFSSRFITKEELNRVLAQIGKGSTIFILPDNGRNNRIL